MDNFSYNLSDFDPPLQHLSASYHTQMIEYYSKECGRATRNDVFRFERFENDDDPIYVIATTFGSGDRFLFFSFDMGDGFSFNDMMAIRNDVEIDPRSILFTLRNYQLAKDLRAEHAKNVEKGNFITNIPRDKLN